jgi:hypothetical protein
MIDTFKHKGQRRKLVESLSGKGITDKNVLSVLNKVPRHLYQFNFQIPDIVCIFSKWENKQKYT